MPPTFAFFFTGQLATADKAGVGEKKKIRDVVISHPNTNILWSDCISQPVRDLSRYSPDYINALKNKQVKFQDFSEVPEYSKHTSYYGVAEPNGCEVFGGKKYKNKDVVSHAISAYSERCENQEEMSIDKYMGTSNLVASCRERFNFPTVDRVTVDYMLPKNDQVDFLQDEEKFGLTDYMNVDTFSVDAEETKL